MAKARMDLNAFVGKLLEEQDGDVLREGIRVLSQALMETEVAGLIGAERHERTGERTTYRNGYRTRTWDTRMGTIELAIPKLRAGTYFPSLLQPRRRAEHALLAVVQEAYVHGVSTRKVDDLMKALGLDGISRSEVSRICGELDTVVAAFRTRPLTGAHRYLWVDATYHKVRVDGRVISQATVVAVGVTTDGDRQVNDFVEHHRHKSHRATTPRRHTLHHDSDVDREPESVFSLRRPPRSKGQRSVRRPFDFKAKATFVVVFVESRRLRHILDGQHSTDRSPSIEGPDGLTVLCRGEPAEVLLRHVVMAHGSVEAV